MKEHQKKDIVFICSILGYIMRTDKFDWDNLDLKLAKKELEKDVFKFIDEMIKIVSATEFDKIHKKIKEGLYYFDVYTNIEWREQQKRALKTRRKVDGESVFDLAEFAIGNNCHNCNLNKKACRLRKSLLKAGVPAYNEKRGMCEYLQEE